MRRHVLRMVVRLVDDLVEGRSVTQGRMRQQRSEEEAVTLSVTVGKDLEEVHRSHRALAERYFGRMKADINAFIDETYRPFVVEKSLTEAKSFTRADGSTIMISPWQVLASEVKKPGGGKAVERMDTIVKKITAQIAMKRREYLSPIEDQQREVMRAIDDSYTRMA